MEFLKFNVYLYRNTDVCPLYAFVLSFLSQTVMELIVGYILLLPKVSSYLPVTDLQTKNDHNKVIPLTYTQDISDLSSCLHATEVIIINQN
jgi:hypothetical protein